MRYPCSRRTIALLIALAVALGVSACGGGNLARQAESLEGRADQAASSEVSGDEALLQAQAEAEQLQAAREQYATRVDRSYSAVLALAKAVNAWDKAYTACIDQSAYIDDFGPCWATRGRPDTWSRRALAARRAIRSQLSSRATSPSCNNAASRVDARIGNLLSAWAGFEETVGASEVDLANSARERVLRSSRLFFKAGEVFERRCDNPDDIT